MEVDNELDKERGQQLASMKAYAEVDLKATDSLNPNPLYRISRNSIQRIV